MVNGLFGAAHAGRVFHAPHVVVFVVARQIMGFFKVDFFLALEIISKPPKTATAGGFGNHNRRYFLWIFLRVSSSVVFSITCWSRPCSMCRCRGIFWSLWAC